MAASDWDVVSGPGQGASGYMSQAEFKASMNRVFGAGKWRDTGGWRSQQRENVLRAQGAQTVAPGHVSSHTLGTDDAPGAHDVVVDGLTPQQVAARLKAEQFPASTTFAEGSHGGQGSHLHVNLAPGGGDEWSAVSGPGSQESDDWTAVSGPGAKPVGFIEGQNRQATSLIGGVVSGAGKLLHNLGEFGDVAARGLNTEAETLHALATGQPTDEANAAIGATAADHTPVISRHTSPLAAQIEAAGDQIAPENRSGLESVLHGAGEMVPTMGAAVVDPALGAVAFGAGGYGESHDEAIAKGASEDTAETAGLENAGVQGVLGALPVGEVAAPVTAGIKNTLARYGAKVGVTAAADASLGAAMQTGTNLVAQQNYDPTRPWYDQVPQSAAMMAAGGLVVHGTHDALGAASNLLRPRERPIPTDGAGNATGPTKPSAPGGMPETDAVRAYAGLEPEGETLTPEAQAAGIVPDHARDWVDPASMRNVTPTPKAPPAEGDAVLFNTADGKVAHGTVEAVEPASSPTDVPRLTVRTPVGRVQVPARQAQVLPGDYEASRISAGAPLEQMPQAISDTAEWRNAAPKGYTLFQAMKDLGGIRTVDAAGKPESDVVQALGGVRRPGLVNNKAGLSPDAMREALQERGWFGTVDQSQAAPEANAEASVQPPGSTVNELYDLMNLQARGNRVLHPADENAAAIQRREDLNDQMQRAGVGAGDSVPDAAAKLAAWRGQQVKAHGAEMESLRARAEELGVTIGKNATYDEALADVVEREAIQGEADGADADHYEGLIDAELTTAEHEWLSAPERGPRGVEGEAFPLEGSSWEPWPNSGAEEGAGEHGEGAGGGGDHADEVPAPADVGDGSFWGSPEREAEVLENVRQRGVRNRQARQAVLEQFPKIPKGVRNAPSLWPADARKAYEAEKARLEAAAAKGNVPENLAANEHRRREMEADEAAKAFDFKTTFPPELERAGRDKATELEDVKAIHEETATAVLQDLQQMDRIAEAQAHDLDPATGEKVKTQKRRDDIAKEVYALSGAVHDTLNTYEDHFGGAARRRFEHLLRQRSHDMSEEAAKEHIPPSDILVPGQPVNTEALEMPPVGRAKAKLAVHEGSDGRWRAGLEYSLPNEGGGHVPGEANHPGFATREEAIHDAAQKARDKVDREVDNPSSTTDVKQWQAVRRWLDKEFPTDAETERLRRIASIDKQANEYERQADQYAAKPTRTAPHEIDYQQVAESFYKIAENKRAEADKLRGQAPEEPPPGAPAVERQDIGGETVQQQLLAGGERSARQAAKAREGALRPKVAQRDAGELFGHPEPLSDDLFSEPWAEEKSLASEPQDIAPTPEAKEAQAAAETPKGEGYGEKNTVFTREAADDARARLRDKFRNQLNSGLDPDLVRDGVILAGYHVEAGARKFGDFARAMLEDLGDQARPYLKMWYEMLRHHPGMDAGDLTPSDDITPDVIAGVAPDVRSRGPDLEPPSAGTAPADGNGPKPLPAPAGEAERGAGSPGTGDAEPGAQPEGGLGLPDGGAAPVGEGGNRGLFEGAPGSGGQPAGGGEPSGGSVARDEGVQPDRVGAADLDRLADESAHLEPVGGNAHPYAESSNAPPVPRELEAALPTLFPEQRSDVAFAEVRFDDPEGHGVMFTNGTGTGKTFTGGGVVKRFHDAGKKNILVVAPSQGILNHWVESMKALGVPFKILEDTSGHGGEGPVGTTYANLANNRTLADRKWDLTVADEAHTLSSDMNGSETAALKTFRAITNHPDRLRWKGELQLREEADKVAALRERAGKATMGPAYDAWHEAREALDEKVDGKVAEFRKEPRSKAVFLSATPFAYDKSIDYGHGYLFDYGPEPQGRGYNTPDAKGAFMVRHFGYRMRYGKLTKPEAAVESEVMERQFHEWLRRTGALSGRVLNVDKDYDRKFVLVNDGVGTKIDQAMEFLQEADDGKFRPFAEVVRKRFNYLARARLLEAINAKHAIPIIEAHHKMGRKVVVFHNYNEGGGFNPFSGLDNVHFVDEDPGYSKALYEEFVARNPYVEELEEGFRGLPSPLDQLKAHFPDALVYNGTVPKAARARAKQAFNQDHGPHNLIIVQSEAGQAGIDLHDTTGAHQRVTLNLGMPGRPVAAIQQEGRTYRIGQASDAIFRYMNTGTTWERQAFAHTIAERAGTAENLALGDQSRSLRESFIQAFLDSAPNPPARGEGVGGKAADRELTRALTDYQKAKSYYFAEGKKGGRRDNREGKDYFATPEPLGLKMTEWADIRPGNKVLEPSAGHGAIARFFPETADRTLVEPSTSLASRAALSSPGARVLEHTFEDLHATNKFDAIVMNPPFGHAGATAIDHVAKAMNHLRDGGRIVALIPRGAADAKFDKLMESDAAKGVFQVANIELPPVTFERAGTAVRSRVVVLERQNDPEAAAGLQQANRDYSGETKIGDLFDRLEDATIKERRIVAGAAADEAPTKQTGATQTAAAVGGPSGFDTGETIHGKTGEPLFVATAKDRMESEAYRQTLALAKAHGGFYSSFRGAGAIPGFQFKSAEDRQAFMDAAKPKFQRPPVFYSAVERHVANSTTTQAPAEQWKSMLANAPGVKKEELAWSGVNDWLDLFPKGEKVPKEKLEAFLRDNGVKVEERVLGGPMEGPRTVQWTDGDAEGEGRGWYVAGHNGDRIGDEVYANHQEASIAANGKMPAQYDNWKLPGGSNYRELLLTLPKEANPPATHWDTPGVLAHVRFNEREAPDGKKVLFIEEVQSDWHQKGRDQGYATPASDEEVRAAGDRVNAAVAASRQAHRELAEEMQTAHDGDLQWARTAQGIAPSIELNDLDTIGLRGVARSLANHIGRGASGEDQRHSVHILDLERVAANAELHVREATDEQKRAQGHGIPDAPFKSSWPALVMKRVIRWAVDNGFERVAWTTGEQQADRYDLTKHINRIELLDNSSGGVGRASMEGPFEHGRVVAHGDGVGRRVIDEHVNSRAELDALIGKELAEKLLATEPTAGRDAGLGHRVRRLEGLDIRTGGEGMQAFYDRNLVNITNDLVRKYGAKVDRGQVIATGSAHGEGAQGLKAWEEWIAARKEEAGLPRDASLEAIIQKRQELVTKIGELEEAYRTRDHASDKRLGIGRAKEAEHQHDVAAVRDEIRALNRVADAMHSREKATPEVHGFDVTDKMREEAGQGLPLFKRPESFGQEIPPSGEQGLVFRRYGTPTEAEAALIDRVEAEVRKIAPFAEVHAASAITSPQGEAHGVSYRSGLRHIIAWSLRGRDVITGRHEAVHALKSAGLFSPQEWGTLTQQALADDWIGKYGVDKRYPDLSIAAQIEEAIADHFAEWEDHGRTGLAGFVADAFKKIGQALARVRDLVRRFQAKNPDWRDVFSRMESGEVGNRMGEPLAGQVGAKFARAPGDRAKEDRAPGSVVNRILGHGVDSVLAKLKRAADRSLPDPILELGDAVKMGASPMGMGSERAQAAAKDFANNLRTSAHQWSKLDEWLNKTFNPEQQRRMWEAADEEGVIRRRGQTSGPGEGFQRLTADELNAVRALQERADAAFEQAQQLGMVNSEGLESYVPRMVVEMTLGGPRILSKTPYRRSKEGANLFTSTGQLRHRKYETVEETEAAAQEHFGSGATVVRNIRTLGLSTSKLEQAIAGRTLVNKIKAMAKDAGGETVLEGGGNPDPHAFFTIDHPALTTWRPKFVTDQATGQVTPARDQNDQILFEPQPVWISKEFEGPMRAVLSTPSNGVVRALMDLKGKMMSLIMYSPLMHNAVIWGKAIPADPKGVLTFQAYRAGNQAKNDPATMKEALQAGLDPIGHRFFNQDLTSIAEGAQIVPGRSWTSQLLAFIPGLFDKEAGAAVKRAVDQFGDLWHNTFLWDRVADLQMGLYTHIRDQLLAKGNETGISAEDAQKVAAHFANRYAGSLPLESMSKLSRTTANMLLFSRSFTLGNLAAYKDILAGLPSDVRAQIKRSSGPEALERVQGVARQKALGMLVMDVALSYVGLFLAAGAAAFLTHQSFQAPWDNENGKEKRFLIGYQPDGTAVYGRLPTGKVGEELQDWVTDPREIALRKLSPYGRLMYAMAANDKGFGQKLYDPYDHTPVGWAKNIGRVTWFTLAGIAPTGQIQGAADLATGHQDPKTAALQAIMPAAGITISKGAPGGPAMADYFTVKDRHDFAVQEAMPGIRRQITGGDLVGARAKMTELGVPPGLQRYYIKVARNPGARLSGRKASDFARMATPEEKAQLQRDRMAAAARQTPAVEDDVPQ